MEHPSIITAFANAKQRTAAGQEPSIYISFKRLNIFYKDTYCILTGTWAEVCVAVEHAYMKVNEEKQEEYFVRGDHNNLLDTPFDTWCSGECKLFSCQDKLKCDDTTLVKCGSNWLTTEHDSKAALDTYIQQITPGHFQNYCIEYM
jgi:hypothetical protein